MLIPGIASADPFDAGDALGTMGEFAVPEYGIIYGAKLIDPDDDVLVATVHIFSLPLITLQTSDAALNISVPDASNWVTSITFLPTTDLGAAKVGEVNGINSFYHALDKKLYFQFSTAGTPTIAAGVWPRLKFGIFPLTGSN